MNQYWTTEDIRKSFGSELKLGQIISEIEKQAWEKGLVLTQVIVNDMSFQEKDEVKFKDEGLNAIKKIEIKTELPANLLKMAIQNSIQILPIAKNNALLISELLQSGQRQEASVKLVSLFELCKDIIDSLNLIQQSCHQWANVKIDQDAWKKNEVLLQSSITQLISSFEAGDLILLADVLEYELSESLDQWYKVLQSIL